MLKSKRIFLTLLSFALFFAGCKDDEVVKPTNSLTAKAGNDQNVNVGSTVALDGSASVDSEGKTFSYQWAFTKKPTGSTANLTDANKTKATFVADIGGIYELELTTSNANGESKDKLLVTAATIESVVLDEIINVKTILEDRVANPDLPDYLVNRDVTVSAELVIKPGVVIAFARDTKLDINNPNGILIAKGEAQKPIRFIGKETTAGFWAGIILRSSSSANELQYVQVLHTGSKNMTGSIKAGLAVTGSSKAEISIKNSLFQSNSGYGLYLERGTVVKGFADNTFKSNGEAGILLDADNVRHLDPNSVFTGDNARNVVEITASNLAENGSSEILWQGFKDKTPYRTIAGLTINAPWKLAPGVILEVGRGGHIIVDDPGYMNAKGTATAKIIIRGAQSSSAFWRGLTCFSTSPENKFEYVEISGGGSTALVSGIKTNIAVYGSQARIEIKNSKISNSGGYGIFVNYQASINADVETTNTFTDNVQGKLLKE